MVLIADTCKLPRLMQPNHEPRDHPLAAAKMALGPDPKTLGLDP